MAKLYFTHGPMGSNKSAMALMTQYNYEQQGYNVLLLKSELDTRDGGYIKSRVVTNKKPCILFSIEDNLKEILLREEIRRIVDLLLSAGIEITDDELLNMIAKEIKKDKSERLVGIDDVKKKFKNAMEEYLERAQEYL